ncbi:MULTISPECIES: hypothetical protein [unclassified Streptomyces]|uniref:hypothetical protein n=1 Tax=Streptomyces TaxID=1883 RepID=UPI0001C1B146|nr:MULTISPECIES: hypothetical protein [unclassified Streptomyces]AEN13558.1 conserved hypothetical protein [Streptomyces sp. SirexAA-E]MYR65150.1 hypothetical protein [Streptomyces sp. SID4939]MYR99762.1 hypothetical protein [Streptomyces sp. SID4940]MYT66994.1 hypothetical protein [Streptomyces sp. SID8357]MYT84638.1 hypothetical protein [Streptomyces sp. SID8360]
MTDNRTSPPVTVTLESGPTGTGSVDDFELFYARRALDRFRTRLGRQGLLDLLAADIEEGNAFLRESARASDGRFTAGTTVLATRGLTSQAFLAWMEKAFAGDEHALLAAHPEHYVMAPGAGGAFNVVENIGPHVCSFFMGGWGTDAMAWAADAAELLPESEFPHKMSSNLFLADGTVVGRALTQFGDTADGFTAHLTVYVPSSCPHEVLDHHLRHYAVEFRNWIVAAAAARD